MQKSRRICTGKKDKLVTDLHVARSARCASGMAENLASTHIFLRRSAKIQQVDGEGYPGGQPLVKA
jgi:hypothetical protein